MKFHHFFLSLTIISIPLYAADQDHLQQEVNQLKQQSRQLESRIERLQNKMSAKNEQKNPVITTKAVKPAVNRYHDSPVTAHAFDGHPESLHFYPTALMVDGEVVTYIAGTPVVSSPYLGERPAFDGSDYIVNISSINRDIRLMQQRRRLYRAYQSMGYPIPSRPIIFISGASQPVATLNWGSGQRKTEDLTLGTSELDVAAALNKDVEAFMSIVYDKSPPAVGGPRVDNSAFNLNMGFINIGNLNKTPFYFTAGQLYVPFGRYSSAMASSPFTLILTRTKSRPFIVGYKSQTDTGPFASIYGFRGETTLGRSGVGGINAGYIYDYHHFSGEIGAGYISSINESAGMQNTGVVPFTVFGGFGSVTNGTELVHKIPGMNIHGNISIDRYNLTAEWVGASRAFRLNDLAYNGHGAKPQAGQLEAGMTFKIFDKPASVGIGYQFTREALALSLPKQRVIGAFNISLWKDTVETLEYRHDINYKNSDFGNGAAPKGTVNAPVFGKGGSSDAIVAQIGVYF